MLKLFYIWRYFQQSFGPNHLLCFDPGQIRTKLLHFHSDLENCRDQFLFNSLLLTFFNSLFIFNFFPANIGF